MRQILQELLTLADQAITINGPEHFPNLKPAKNEIMKEKIEAVLKEFTKREQESKVLAKASSSNIEVKSYWGGKETAFFEAARE